jgi:hypothetical protein
METVGISNCAHMNKQGETTLPLSKVKQKGQVTIPAEIREELKIAAVVKGVVRKY